MDLLITATTKSYTSIENADGSLKYPPSIRDWGDLEIKKNNIDLLPYLVDDEVTISEQIEDSDYNYMVDNCTLTFRTTLFDVLGDYDLCEIKITKGKTWYFIFTPGDRNIDYRNEVFSVEMVGAIKYWLDLLSDKFVPIPALVGDGIGSFLKTGLWKPEYFVYPKTARYIEKSGGKITKSNNNFYNWRLLAGHGGYRDEASQDILKGFYIPGSLEQALLRELSDFSGAGSTNLYYSLKSVFTKILGRLPIPIDYSSFSNLKYKYTNEGNFEPLISWTTLASCFEFANYNSIGVSQDYKKWAFAGEEIVLKQFWSENMSIFIKKGVVTFDKGELLCLFFHGEGTNPMRKNEEGTPRGRAIPEYIVIATDYPYFFEYLRSNKTYKDKMYFIKQKPNISAKEFIVKLLYLLGLVIKYGDNGLYLAPYGEKKGDSSYLDLIIDDEEFKSTFEPNNISIIAKPCQYNGPHYLVYKSETEYKKRLWASISDGRGIWINRHNITKSPHFIKDESILEAYGDKLKFIGLDSVYKTSVDLNLRIRNIEFDFDYSSSDVPKTYMLPNCIAWVEIISSVPEGSVWSPNVSDKVKELTPLTGVPDFFELIGNQVINFSIKYNPNWVGANCLFENDNKNYYIRKSKYKLKAEIQEVEARVINLDCSSANSILTFVFPEDWSKINQNNYKSVYQIKSEFYSA